MEVPRSGVFHVPILCEPGPHSAHQSSDLNKKGQSQAELGMFEGSCCTEFGVILLQRNQMVGSTWVVTVESCVLTVMRLLIGFRPAG